MTIREIELNNFRIYKGRNKIELFPDGNKNGSSDISRDAAIMQCI